MARKGKGGKGGDAEVTMTVDHSAVDKVAAALPGQLDGEVGDAFKSLGERFVSDTRRAIKSGPASGGGRQYRPHNSRERAARGVDFKVSNGKLVLVSDPASMDQGRRAFPAAWNQARWQHPVFGRRGIRVSQRGAGSWWKPEAYSKQAEQLLTDAGQKALDKADT